MGLFQDHSSGLIPRVCYLCFTGEAAKMIDESSMLTVCDQIHIVLIKTEITGETTLVSSHFLEWRPVLTANTGRLQTSLELKGTGI